MGSEPPEGLAVPESGAPSQSSGVQTPAHESGGHSPAHSRGQSRAQVMLEPTIWPPSSERGQGPPFTAPPGARVNSESEQGGGADTRPRPDQKQQALLSSALLLGIWFKPSQPQLLDDCISFCPCSAAGRGPQTAVGWVGGHPSLPPHTAPLRGPRRPGCPSVSSGDGRPRQQQLLPCPVLMEKEASLRPADPGPRGRTHGGEVSARSCAQGRNRASSQSPRPGWHRPQARDGHTSSVRVGARPGGTDACGAASPARCAPRTTRPPLRRACWGPGAPPGRGEGMGSTDGRAGGRRQAWRGPHR